MENKKNVVMRQKQGLVELIVGITGCVLFFFLPNQWIYVPMIVYGIVSVAMIRRDVGEKQTEDEIRCIRKRNVTTIICWVVIALISYITFRGSQIGEGWGWFVLSAYTFFIIHGLAFLAPLNVFPNEKK